MMRAIRRREDLPRCVRALQVYGVVLAVVLVSNGCTQMTRYYTLSAVPASGVPGTTAHSAVIAVGPVELPDYVDRPQIVVRTGPNTIDQAVFDQWGGTLDDMVPRLLVEDLGLRMPNDHFVSFPQVSDLPFDYRVPISISQLDVSTSGEAVVAARWQIRRQGAEALAVRETVARAQATDSSFDARVAALSRALADLTTEIAATFAATGRTVATGSSVKKTRGR